MLSQYKALYFKHKEIVSYLAFGAATTLVNWIVYSLMVGGLGVNMNAANATAWVAAVVFAFVTNKIWVFKSKEWKAPIVIKEGTSFLGSRLVSGVFEIGALPILIKLGLNQQLFGVDGFVAKILISIVVIILNYVFSKWFVFRNNSHSRSSS